MDEDAGNFRRTPGKEKEEEGEQQMKRIKAPRLNHKKSRNGCQRCRVRRVKCDEKHPTCSNCDRHSIPCIYPTSIVRQLSNARPSLVSGQSTPDYGDANTNERWQSLSPSISHSAQNSDGGVITPGAESMVNLALTETTARRKLELRLIHHFTVKTCPTFPATHNASVLAAWTIDVPKLAFSYKALLHEIFAISALHLARTLPDKSSMALSSNGPSVPGSSPGFEKLDFLATHHTYLDLALRLHRHAVAELSTGNADAISFTSIMILVDAFASLQERVVVPYTPPMQWLQMARGAASVFRESIKWIEDLGNGLGAAKIRPVVRSDPDLTGVEKFFAAGYRRDLVRLLDPHILAREPGAPAPEEEAAEVWDRETVTAYENILSYIGSIKGAVDDGESANGTHRRLITFAIVTPRRFVQLLEDRSPRALVVLGVFFGIAGLFKELWWIGKTPAMEIDAIKSYIGHRWIKILDEYIEVVTGGKSAISNP